MIKKIKFIALSSIVLITSGCTKIQDYSIRGYVKELNTNLPVPNATIKLEYQKDGIDISMYETILLTKTDSTGYFNITHSTTHKSLILSIIPDDTFMVFNKAYPKYYSDYRINITSEDNFLESISLYKYGLFSINFEAEKQFIEGDTLYLTVDAGSIGISEGIYPPKVHLPDNRSYLCYGNEYVYFHWEAKRHNENQFKQFNDSLLCLPGINNAYEIKL